MDNSLIFQYKSLNRDNVSPIAYYRVCVCIVSYTYYLKPWTILYRLPKSISYYVYFILCNLMIIIKIIDIRPGIPQTHRIIIDGLLYNIQS